MLGAIAGDIIGSRFEGKQNISEEFELFTSESHFTDDTVLTFAIASSLINSIPYSKTLRSYTMAYPKAGFSFRTRAWAEFGKDGERPSPGNGSAMRVSPLGWFFQSLKQTLHEAAKSAIPSHNHPEAIQGAQAIAAGIFYGRAGKDKSELKQFIERHFKYDLDLDLVAERQSEYMDVKCRTTVPQAFAAFLESTDFESAIRIAVSLGGDTDTLACMAGALAEAYYKEIPEEIERQVLSRLNDSFLTFLNQFRTTKCSVVKIVAQNKHLDLPISKKNNEHLLQTSSTQYPSEISGKLVVIGDIHGRATDLKRLLEKLQRMLPDLHKRWIVFVGDFIDRGPYSKLVLDIVVKLKNTHGKVTSCMGNHEHICAQALGLIPTPEPPPPNKSKQNLTPRSELQWPDQKKNTPSSPVTLYRTGYASEKMFASYGVAIGDMKTLHAALPEEHISILRDLPWVVEHPDYLIVHAGLTPDIPTEEQLKQLRMPDFKQCMPSWLYDHDLARTNPPIDCNKTVISGHTIQQEVVIRNKRILLDTRGRGGKLSAVALPEKVIIQ